MTPRQGLLVLIGVGSLIRLALAGAVGPGNDEAYYALYARHLDWSYFDHPPLVGWIVAAVRLFVGVERVIIIDRLGFVGLFAGSTWLMFRLTTRWFGQSAGLAAAFALNLVPFFGIAVGTFVLPDGPLLFFWLLCLDRLAVGLERPDSLGSWVLVGLAWGGALLSKYQSLALPVGTLAFVIVGREWRVTLRQPGPYVALLLGLIVATPVWWWNAREGGASLIFQGGRAMGGHFAPWNLAIALLAQAAYLSPWVAWPLSRALARRGDEMDRARCFFVCNAAPVILVFAAVACTRDVFPHWALIGFATLLPLLGRDWAGRHAEEPRRMARRFGWMAIGSCLLPLLLLAQGWTGLIPGLADPTRDVVGWPAVAAEVRRVAKEGRLRFVFAGNWAVSAHLSYELGDQIPVLCYNAGDARGFADWSEPTTPVGTDGLLVAVDDRSIEPGCYEPYFRRIERVETFEVRRLRTKIRSVRLFRGIGQIQPFPFGRIQSVDRDDTHVIYPHR